MVEVLQRNKNGVKYEKRDIYEYKQTDSPGLIRFRSRQICAANDA